MVFKVRSDSSLLMQLKYAVSLLMEVDGESEMLPNVNEEIARARTFDTSHMHSEADDEADCVEEDGLVVGLEETTICQWS